MRSHSHTNIHTMNFLKLLSSVLQQLRSSSAECKVCFKEFVVSVRQRPLMALTPNSGLCILTIQYLKLSADIYVGATLLLQSSLTSKVLQVFRSLQHQLSPSARLFVDAIVVVVQSPCTTKLKWFMLYIT